MIREFDPESSSHQTASSATQSLIFALTTRRSKILRTFVVDLKKVLSNVQVRGTFGEVQLATILEQFLSPGQFIKNVQIKENSQERVEFAIRLPGRDSDGEVLLPVDAKFPQEDYERLIAAAEWEILTRHSRPPASRSGCDWSLAC